MARTAALALAFLALMGGPAQATTFEVVVVPGLTLAELETRGPSGAVGLLNPGAGPETSQELAWASLVRGEVRNSLRGGPPSGAWLFTPQTGALGSVEGPAIYLGLPQGGPQSNDRRYPILVAAPGYEGLVTSDSTRIPGLVSIADVAPTALGRDGALGFEPAEEPFAELRALDERIDENNDARLPATLLVCALVLGLALVRPRAAVPGLAAALLVNLALGLAGVSGLAPALVLLGVSVAAGGPLLARVLRSPLALGALLAAVVAAYLIAFALDGPGVALSPFGPTQNSRYYGLSNLLSALLLVPALAGATLLRAYFGWAGFAAAALLAFAVVAGNRFGADGGGAIVLAAGLAVLAVLLAGGGRRAVVLGLLAALALALGLVAVDAATGSSSHVTRALEGGPGGLAGDLGERVELSFERATADWLTGAAVAFLLALLAALVARVGRREVPLAARAVPLALAAAVGVSLVVNDSPVDVLLVGTTAFVAAAAGMLSPRWTAVSPSSPPSSRSSWSPAAGAPRPPSPGPRR